MPSTRIIFFKVANESVPLIVFLDEQKSKRVKAKCIALIKLASNKKDTSLNALAVTFLGTESGSFEQKYKPRKLQIAIFFLWSELRCSKPWHH